MKRYLVVVCMCLSGCASTASKVDTNIYAANAGIPKVDKSNAGPKNSIGQIIKSKRPISVSYIGGEGNYELPENAPTDATKYFLDCRYGIDVATNTRAGNVMLSRVLKKYVNEGMRSWTELQYAESIRYNGVINGTINMTYVREKIGKVKGGFFPKEQLAAMGGGQNIPRALMNWSNTGLVPDCEYVIEVKNETPVALKYKTYEILIYSANEDEIGFKVIKD